MGIVVAIGVVWDEHDEHGDRGAAEEDGTGQSDVRCAGFGDIGGELQKADAFVAKAGVRVDGDVMELVRVFVVWVGGVGLEGEGVGEGGNPGLRTRMSVEDASKLGGERTSEKVVCIP